MLAVALLLAVAGCVLHVHLFGRYENGSMVQREKDDHRGLLLSLLAALSAADQFFPGEWFSAGQYEAAALFIGGLTAVSMRLGIAKATPT